VRILILRGGVGRLDEDAGCRRLGLQRFPLIYDFGSSPKQLLTIVTQISSSV
jgi:hypothetical protein